MMEKLAQPGEVGGVLPPPFTMSTITYKVVVYAPAERADTLTLFLLYPFLYSVGLTMAINNIVKVDGFLIIAIKWKVPSKFP
jgi:hypothetical protein